MHRRGMIRGLATAIAGAFAAGSHSDDAHAAVVPAEAPKVAYHLCDLDKVNMALGNIRNHYQGMGGAEAVTIRLVVIGPALKAFHAANARPDVARELGEFRKLGLALSACANTMRSQNITVKDLLPGFASADRGGVVELAELQRQGYAYLRP
jgi:intracellular sulfur oxidation DsrE/DsrF family protein